jgi:hypothetical protein
MGQEVAKESNMIEGIGSPHSCIRAASASEWLIFLLQAGGEGMEITLWDVMDFGHSHGDIAIIDDHGNTYPLGTSMFAWAFEVSLWHHVRAGYIECACETAEQKKLWSEFLARREAPSPPDMKAPQPLWQIPFRLADALHGRQVRIVHVGKVEAWN